MDRIELDSLAHVPKELRDLPNWVCSERQTGKPIDAKTGLAAKSNDASTWCDFETALAAAKRGRYGVAFAVAPPYLITDLDACRIRETGTIARGSLEIVRLLNTYTEISQSGAGLHLICKASLPPGPRKRGNKKSGGVEMYDREHFLTLTGNRLKETPAVVNECDVLPAYVLGILGFEEQKFGDLWLGNWEKYYPSQSEADLAFCSMLAGKVNDAAKIDSVFRRTHLYREKWSEKRGTQTYGEITIAKALAGARVIETVPAAVGNLAVETTIVLESFADIEAKPLVWMWKDRIPKSKLTIFSGNPDVGKSTVLCDIIARYTTGRDYPDGAPNTIGAGEVLMMIAEDDAGDTVKPRLMAAGADLSRVRRLKAVEIIQAGGQNAKKQERMLALDTDLAMLEETLQKNPQIKLVTIDPITSYIGRADLNKEQELRRVLGPLRDLAERAGITFICLGHFNKRSDVIALHKLGGAVAMSGVPRAVWLFAKSPDTEDEYLMLRGKCNLTKKRTGLKYRIESKELPALGEQPFIAWLGEADGDADTVLATERNPEQKRQAKAERFLAEYLAGGAAPSDEIIAEGKSRHISRNALFEAKKAMGIVAQQRDRQWFWRLREAPTTQVGTEMEEEPEAEPSLF